MIIQIYESTDHNEQRCSVNASLLWKEKNMDTTNITTIVLAVIVAFIIGGLIGMAFNRRQRTKRLQEKFGPEYERTIHEIGDKRQAEHELEARLDHVKSLEIRPLSAEEIDRYTSEWRATQAEFVDEPLAALQKADRIIREVMKEKGYPVEDFEQRVADISVDYPELVTDYRGLHLIAVKEDDEEVSTEEMRQAMVHGRALFENLVNKVAQAEELDEKESI
jgi:hypothetical protein